MNAPVPQTTGGLNIVVAAVAGATGLSGVARHAANLTRCLLTRDDVAAVHLVIAPWQYNDMRALLPHNTSRLHLHSVDVGRNAISRNLWYYTQLPRLASLLNADIVHLAYPVPIRQAAFLCPTVATLHDLYPYDIPANFGFTKVLFNRIILQQCLRSVDAIACVSESTQRRLDMHEPAVAVQKTTVIYNCVDAGPKPSATSPIPDWHGEPFLLCVAQHRRNKNIPLAIDVFQRLLDAGDLRADTRLFIVGIPGPETRTIQRHIEHNDLSREVVLLSGITDPELEWFYAHCDLLLAPSTIEGFGLPIVEAMFHQCRVVCSDIAAFREVGGSYPVYASLHHCTEESFMAAARSALSNHRFRTPSTERFASTHIAADYMNLYQRLRLRHTAKADTPSSIAITQLERGRP